MCVRGPHAKAGAGTNKNKMIKNKLITTYHFEITI